MQVGNFRWIDELSDGGRSNSTGFHIRETRAEQQDEGKEYAQMEQERHLGTQICEANS